MSSYTCQVYDRTNEFDPPDSIITGFLVIGIIITVIILSPIILAYYIGIEEITERHAKMMTRKCC